MKSPHHPFLAAILTGAIFAGASALEAQAEPDDAKPERHEDRRHPAFGDKDGDPFGDLSPEQRDRLREAVRRAWSDPGVIQARDEVKVATEAYQKALAATLTNTDPETAKLVERFRQHMESESKGYLSPGMSSPGRGPGPGGPGGPGGSGRERRDIEGFMIMENPSFLRDLDDTKRAIYREAHRKAVESPEVKARIEALRTLRNQDEEVRKKRTEVIRGMHQALRLAMVESDPRVAEFLPKLSPSEGWHPDGEPGEKRDSPPKDRKPGSPPKPE